MRATDDRSWTLVDGLAAARDVLGSPGTQLDLRARAALDPAWAALEAVEVVPGELLVPVPQHLADVAATRALGARLATELRAGDLVVLSGPLGAGKTSLVQGLGAALGVTGQVSSPTFVIAREHRGPLPLLHVDAYRLREHGAPVDLDDLGIDTALEHGVTVVEWGEGLAQQISDSWLEVLLERSAPAGPGADHRVARVRRHGLRWAVLPTP